MRNYSAKPDVICTPFARYPLLTFQSTASLIEVITFKHFPRAPKVRKQTPQTVQVPMKIAQSHYTSIMTMRLARHKQNRMNGDDNNSLEGWSYLACLSALGNLVALGLSCYWITAMSSFYIFLSIGKAPPLNIKQLPQIQII